MINDVNYLVKCYPLLVIIIPFAPFSLYKFIVSRVCYYDCLKENEIYNIRHVCLSNKENNFSFFSFPFFIFSYLRIKSRIIFN